MKTIVIIAIAFVLLIPSPIFAPSHPEYIGFEKPLKQVMHGIAPEAVKCNEELVLILRTSGAPACVTPETAEKFEHRGLGVIAPPCCKKLHSGPSLESPKSVNISSLECSGSAQCITGTVTRIVDGDTIHVDGQSIRFALSSAPELNEPGGIESREFIKEICPVGSIATVDEDDGQTQGSYGRILGVVYCNGMNLNEELVDSGLGYLITGFCDDSEFASNYWAQKHGCDSKSETVTPSITEKNCDSSYPDVCIAPYPPDLNCGDIPYKDFKVLRPDPHGFDGDYDGIGCETYNP
jgi:micrococcal nuclease